MKSKIFTLIIAMAMMLSFIGVASAGDGTINDPMLILYVGNDGWNMFPFNNGQNGYDVEVDGVYYSIEYIEGYGDYNVSWSIPWIEPSDDYAMVAEYSMLQYFDVVFIDMVNVPYDFDLNDPYQEALYDLFITAFDDAAEAGTKIITLRTAPYDVVNNTQLDPVMPLEFDFIDTTDFTENNSIPYAIPEPGIVQFVSVDFGPLADDLNAVWGTATQAECDDVIGYLSDFINAI